MPGDAASRTALEDPETEVLLAAVGTWLGTVDDGRLDRALQADPDWDRVVTIAERHGLSALLHRAFERSAATVPETTRSDLERSARDVARRNLVLLDETYALIDALREAGVRAVPYKGPVLAATLYGDLALRASIDVDLLVRAADLDAASAVLAERGYERPADEARYEAVLGRLASSHHRRFVRTEPTLRVELHWRFASPRWSPSPRADTALESVELAEVHGRELEVLAPEVRLVGLCVHGGRHAWSRLAWLLDVSLLAGEAGLDWDRVLAVADDWRVERLVLLGLALAEEMFDLPLPETVRARIAADAGLPSLLEAAVDRSLGGDGPPSASAPLWFQLRAADRHRDRLATLVRLAFVPSWKDVEAVSLPSRLSVLYYVVRPVRLGWRACAGIS